MTLQETVQGLEFVGGQLEIKTNEGKTRYEIAKIKIEGDILQVTTGRYAEFRSEVLDWSFHDCPPTSLSVRASSPKLIETCTPKESKKIAFATDRKEKGMLLPAHHPDLIPNPQ